MQDSWLLVFSNQPDFFFLYCSLLGVDEVDAGISRGFDGGAGERTARMTFVIAERANRVAGAGGES